MAVGDLITTDGQVEIAGTVYAFRQVEGLDMPELRTSDVARPNDHGIFVGNDRYGGRTLRWTLDVEATSDIDAQNRISTLQAGMQGRTDDLLTIAWQQRGQGRRVAAVKPRRLAWMGDQELYMLRAPTLLLELFAPDPRIYDYALLSPSGGLPAAASGGATFPATFNLLFSALTGSTGVFTANNAGLFPTRPVATIRGPITDPRIENITAGAFVRFSGLVLGASDTLTVDFDARTVLLNGTASRYSLMSTDSDWWELLPGDNSIRFTAAGYQAAALLTLTYRSAWI